MVKQDVTELVTDHKAQLFGGELLNERRRDAQRPRPRRVLHYERAVVGVGLDEQFEGGGDAEDLSALLQRIAQGRHHPLVDAQRPREQPTTTVEAISARVLIDLALRELHALVGGEARTQVTVTTTNEAGDFERHHLLLQRTARPHPIRKTVPTPTARCCR